MRNNFRRLLQHYARGLKLGAKNGKHRDAEAFVEEIKGDSDNKEGIEETGAEEDEQCEGSLRELHYITEFFVQSSAFLTLRQKLNGLVHPSTTTELWTVVRAWLESGNKWFELVKFHKLPTLITELQYIPKSQIRLQSKDEAVKGYFKSMMESFKGKVESWTMEPWTDGPWGPPKGF
ncbi:hypothetical protein LY78DRAFT_687133 [Colletotrichum sublineola]|nr:hypothetical protein LY78DRAFT_687133 [Colletotrichum sublineola]